jgi:Cu2+-exporting ATPase
MSASNRGGDAVMEKERSMDDHAGHNSHDSHAAHGGGHAAHAGHGDHAGVFRRKFWLSLALTVPAVVYSHGRRAHQLSCQAFSPLSHNGR